MKNITVLAGALVLLLAVLTLAAGHRFFERRVLSVTAPAPELTATATEAHQAFLYGRITTLGGASYEGRLRWGGDEEALWSHTFNGVKEGNPWLVHVPPERLPKERRSIEIFGVEFGSRERQIDLGRPFMARFGDITRLEARGIDGVRVTLKSGTVFDLDRLSASDFDDGVRVWDLERGVVDLDSRLIHTVDHLSPARPVAGPHPLHGTVRTRQGEFTGFIQWNREDSVGSDELVGETADDTISLRFDTIQSIARHSRDSSLVRLLDGGELVLSGTRAAGHGNRGLYVDDQRYGRVLISWDAFERVDFSPGGPGPAYDDFSPGRPLTGSVTIRPGLRLTGRLVYDLDESETTETLDAPSEGVDYTIPFGLIASIMVPGIDEHVAVTLHDGEELRLERSGDLGEGNAGMLIFSDGGQRAEYVPWVDVERIDFERPYDESAERRVLQGGMKNRQSNGEVSTISWNTSAQLCAPWGSEPPSRSGTYVLQSEKSNSISGCLQPR